LRTTTSLARLLAKQGIPVVSVGYSLAPADLLLGVDAGTDRHTHAVPLRSGATVLLYTDGLIERRDATLDDGFARLLAAAAGLERLPVDSLCDELFTRLDPELTDDIAILALRARG